MNNEQQNQAKQLGLVHNEARSKRLVWGIGTAIVLLIGVLGWNLMQDKEPPMIYKTAPVQRGDIALTVTATGNITPKDQVEVSSELSGIVKEVFVDYNDKVKAGQKLAQLDTSKVSATVTQRQSVLRSAQAQVKTAEANLEEANLNLAYNQSVWDASEGRQPSQQVMNSARIAVSKAKASLEQAKASVENAKAELAYAESDLAKSTIVSPIDGVVLSRNVEPGQTVASSFSAPTLFVIARDLKAMELVVAIDEADIGVIELGQKAKFTVDAYRGHQFNGEITQIRLMNSAASGATSSVVSYNTVLTVDNEEQLLLPGMTAVSNIAVRTAQNALVIENAALRYQPEVQTNTAQASRGVSGVLMPRFNRGGGQKKAGVENAVRDLVQVRDATVWVLDGKQARAVDIKIGITNGTHTQVVSGELKEGDLVISDAVKVIK
ncbi:MAG: efflux RND transporter periplasmic adaptor subunit [Venatoribacter sp.]